MTIREWFHQLFHFRSIILSLYETNHKLIKLVEEYRIENGQLEQAIRCRDYALASLAIGEPEQSTEVHAVRVGRLSYAEIQRQQERSMSYRFREIDKRATAAT